MRKINKKTLKELGFTPFNTEYEFVHWGGEYAYNLKDNSLWAFCEVDGMYERLCVMSDYSDLEDFIDRF